jgi:hypothetical protein
VLPFVSQPARCYGDLIRAYPLPSAWPEWQRSIALLRSALHSAPSLQSRPVTVLGITCFAGMVFILRYFFDPGSGVCLWAANDEAYQQFGYPVELDSLPLSASTRSAAEELISRFDTGIDWEYPAGPSPWTASDEQSFLVVAREVLRRIRGELGAAFDVRDELDPTQSAGETGALRLNLTLLGGSHSPPQGMTVGESFDFYLKPSESMIIGRAPEVEFRVVSPSIGRRAVRLTAQAQGIWVEDLASGGGSAIVVNNVTTPRPACYLTDGAVLLVGAVPFRVAVHPMGECH